MKQLLMLVSFCIISIIGYSQTDTATIKKGTADTTKVLYTCSMHPEIITDKPGSCPKCGMTLILATKGSEHKGMMMPGMMMGGGMMHSKSGKKFPWKILMGGMMVLMMGSMMLLRNK